MPPVMLVLGSAGEGFGWAGMPPELRKLNIVINGDELID
jgi:hypothetical protein